MREIRVEADESKAVAMPMKAINNTSCGRIVRFLWMMSFSSSIGMGV